MGLGHAVSEFQIERVLTKTPEKPPVEAWGGMLNHASPPLTSFITEARGEAEKAEAEE